MTRDDESRGIGAGERGAITKLSGCVVDLSGAAPAKFELATLSAFEGGGALARRPDRLRGSR
ncbi:hypothetical protein GCM10027596_40160 [Nocardioides korecus]